MQNNMSLKNIMLLKIFMLSERARIKRVYNMIPFILHSTTGQTNLWSLKLELGFPMASREWQEEGMRELPGVMVIFCNFTGI